MPIKLKWMKRSGKHLETIYFHLAQQNERAAIELYNALIDSADVLLTFPLAGKKEPAFKDNPRGYRSLVVCEHYKLIYKIEEEFVKIMAVWDCRQNPSKLKNSI